MIKIYYYAAFDPPNFVSHLGEDVPKQIKEKYSEYCKQTIYPQLSPIDVWQNTNTAIKRCPAFNAYVNQMWSIDSPENVCSNSMRDFEINLLFTKKLIEGCSNGLPLIESPYYKCQFFTEEPNVWIETFPPYFHINPSIRLIPGSFNISNWQRPIIPTFEVLDERIQIKKGDPLQYIRFRCENPQETFNLIQITSLPETTEKKIENQAKVKVRFPRKSWKYVTGKIKNPDRVCVPQDIYD